MEIAVVSVLLTVTLAWPVAQVEEWAWGKVSRRRSRKPLSPELTTRLAEIRAQQLARGHSGWGFLPPVFG
jgi:hypothetical protein